MARTIAWGGAFLVMAISGLANAQSAVEWKVSEGGNGHWYLLTNETVVGWELSKVGAEARGGHLATLNSIPEAELLRQMAFARGVYGGYVGLKLQGRVWGWITGEPLVDLGAYRLRVSGDGSCGNFIDLQAGAPYAPSLNDIGCDWWNGPYFVEWEADCNADGKVDYGQIRRGELADLNGNSVPDCCEQSTSCNTGAGFPVEWRVEDGGNGHWYMMNYNETPGLFAREALVESWGAHLATLQSVAEHTFVFTVSMSQGGFASGEGWPALGGYRAAGTTQWRWVTGENFDYAPWAPGEPNGSIGLWAYTQMWGQFDTPGLVIDDNTTMQGGQCGVNRRAMIEWDADCNGDGRVDLGQIFRGELADANGNNIPDACEGVIQVPADHPTIQAAIDAATQIKNRIMVSEGTYHEAIDFKGKAVTVKAVGARANTIIDGTGLTTSIVRAVTGETASTVLEGFTIRNGPIGSQVSTYRLGGGMYIDHASPTVRDCAFVSNSVTAGAGGALAAINSQSVIDGCTFTQNAAATGGGLWLDGGRPTLSNCVITSNSASGHGGGVFATPNPAQLPNAVLVGNTICANIAADAGRMNAWALFDDGGNAICDCMGDVDGNGIADPADISLTLLFFGSDTDPEFIQPDQDMNGAVDTGDVSLLLLGFGPCEN